MLGMIKSFKNLPSVKALVKSLSGKAVEVSVNLGRNKIINYSGKLTGVYPSLFSVTPNESDSTFKTSYSYNEIINGTVIIKENEK